MKKLLFTMLFSLIAVFACVFTVSADDLVAGAANDFSVVVTELSAPEGQYAQAGDLKVEVWITDNQGYAGFGGAVYYDADNYSVVMNSGGDVAIVELLDGAAHVVEDNTSKSMVAIAIGSGSNIRSDRVLEAFYLRPKTNCDNSNPITGLSVLQFVNANKEDITYTEPTTYEYTYVSQAYVIGDVNGDGVIDSVDSVIVSQVVEANGGSISAEDFSENTPFIEYDDVVCIGVVDADGDNDIDADDSREILIYYRNTSIMGTPYEGLVGTTGYYYTEVLPL